MGLALKLHWYLVLHVRFVSDVIQLMSWVTAFEWTPFVRCSFEVGQSLLAADTRRSFVSRSKQCQD